jgi:multisubunit Na+/H+ antiporter MnhE subunit
VWWLVLYGFYLSVISTISITELLVGALFAAACAAAAVAARRALRDDAGSFRAPLRALPFLPAQVAYDARVLLLPRPPGRFDVVPLRPGAANGVVTLLLSTAPGTYVVRVSADRDRLLVHRIGAGPSRLDREVMR